MDALMKNVAGWKRVGNPAVDMVAEVIYKARQQQRPLRSIHLKPAFFAMIIYFAVQNAGEQNIFGPDGNLAAPIVCDGVAILKGSKFQANTMSFDYWPLGHKEVEGYREHQAETGEFPEHLSLLQ